MKSFQLVYLILSILYQRDYLKSRWHVCVAGFRRVYLNPWPEIQAVMSCPTRVLGTEPGCSRSDTLLDTHRSRLPIWRPRDYKALSSLSSCPTPLATGRIAQGNPLSPKKEMPKFPLTLKPQRPMSCVLISSTNCADGLPTKSL